MALDEAENQLSEARGVQQAQEAEAAEKAYESEMMEHIQLGPKMRYTELWRAVSSSSGMVRSGDDLLDRACSVTRLTLARDQDTPGVFGMIFSMSRTVAVQSDSL